jgi:hypothetical protein
LEAGDGDLDDDDEIVADGQSVRCPLYLCDSVQRAMVAKYGVFDANDHKPHHPELSPELREFRAKTRSEYLRQISDAWKLPAHGFNQNIDEGGRIKVTRSNVARAADADEDPSARASAVEKQLERWQGRDLSELAREVDARRRAAHAEFCNTLSNAWRGGK